MQWNSIFIPLIISYLLNIDKPHKPLKLQYQRHFKDTLQAFLHMVKFGKWEHRYFQNVYWGNRQKLCKDRALHYLWKRLFLPTQVSIAIFGTQ